ncbi:MAG: adenosine-specific kinase [candidate division Zixibacteria bacterium]|nr:adenosine-specific kinase [candidate division Zixibacteria bacterium]
MDIEAIEIAMPDGCNVIFGQSHFIKTAESLYEAMVNGSPGVKFGLAFSEASQECLIRTEGSDDELIKLSAEALMNIGCGHSFIIYLKDAFPINFLPAIKNVPEVVGIFCATANPLQVVIARSKQGGAVLGVIDGLAPKGIEEEHHRQARKKFLRDIGYKL